MFARRPRGYRRAVPERRRTARADGSDHRGDGSEGGGAHLTKAFQRAVAALQYGAPFGYLDWFTATVWYRLGNVIGGVALVSGLRLVQVGGRRVDAERYRDPSTRKPGR